MYVYILLPHTHVYTCICLHRRFVIDEHIYTYICTYILVYTSTAYISKMLYYKMSFGWLKSESELVENLNITP